MVRVGGGGGIKANGTLLNEVEGERGFVSPREEKVEVRELEIEEVVDIL